MTEDALERRLFALMHARGPDYVARREALLAELDARPALEAMARSIPAPLSVPAPVVGEPSPALHALRAPSSIDDPGFRDVWRPLLARALVGGLHRREELELVEGLIEHTIAPPAGTGAPLTTEPYRVPSIVAHGALVVPLVVELLVFVRSIPSEREAGTAFAVLERLRDPLAREPLVAIADDPTQPERTREIATRVAALVYRDPRALALAEARAFHPLPRRQGRPAWVAGLAIVVEAHVTGIAPRPDLGARLRERFEDPALTDPQRGDVLEHLIRVGERGVVPALVEGADGSIEPSLAYPWFRALARLGAPDTIPLLQRIASDAERSGDERDAAASALHAIGASRFPPP